MSDFSDLHDIMRSLLGDDPSLTLYSSDILDAAINAAAFVDKDLSDYQVDSIAKTITPDLTTNRDKGVYAISAVIVMMTPHIGNFKFQTKPLSITRNRSEMVSALENRKKRLLSPDSGPIGVTEFDKWQQDVTDVINAFTNISGA